MCLQKSTQESTRETAPVLHAMLTGAFFVINMCIVISYGIYPETDSLYIDLSEKTDVESVEISEGIVLDDYDTEGNLAGIDIDNASKKVQLNELTLSRLPGDVHTVAA